MIRRLIQRLGQRKGEMSTQLPMHPFLPPSLSRFSLPLMIQPAALPIMQGVEPTNQAPMISPTLDTPVMTIPPTPATPRPTGEVSHLLIETPIPLQTSMLGNLAPTIALTHRLTDEPEKTPKMTPQPSMVFSFFLTLIFTKNAGFYAIGCHMFSAATTDTMPCLSNSSCFIP